MNAAKLSRKLLRLVYPTRCPYCDGVLARPAKSCGECAPGLSCEPFQKAVFADVCCYSAFVYEGRYSEAIKRFKFSGRTSYAYSLAFAAADAAKRSGAVFDCVTCVPMHPVNRRERGYNQARLIAKNCAEIMGVPYLDLLEKHRRNRLQHTLGTLDEKRRNVKDVFRAAPGADISGKRILLIDDVVTTGSTLNACCRELAAARAGFIACATVCAAYVRDDL